MFFVRSVEDDNQESKRLMDIEDQQKASNIDDSNICKKLRLATDLWRRNRLIKLLTPLNIAFGLTLSFTNIYVNGTSVKNAIGADNVGYAAAISPGTAALLSFPFAFTGRLTRPGFLFPL